MTVICLYEDENEKRQHVAAIQIIIRDERSSEEEIRLLYEGVLQELKREAKVKNFLTVIVSRKVKDLLHARGR
jgi:hypothetical protein